MVSKKLAIILIVGVGFSLAAAYLYYSSLQQHNLVEISKQSPLVQNYLTQHPNATHNIVKSYVTSEGMLYTVYEDWELKDEAGSVGASPQDGKDHHCWIVRWYDPTSMIMHRVNVFIDRDSLQIILVTEET